MADTDRTSMAGALVTINASAVAEMKETSALISACNFIDIKGTDTIKWYVRTRSAAASAHTAGGAVTAKTVSLVGVDANPKAFPFRVTVDQELIDRGGEFVQHEIGAAAGESIAAGIDESITALYDDWANSVGSAGASLTLQKILYAKGKLLQTGYKGEIVVVLHPGQILDLNLESLGKFTPASNEEIMSGGFLGRMFGLSWFMSESVAVDGDDDAFGAMYFRRGGIGVAVDSGVDGMNLVKSGSAFVPGTLQQDIAFWSNMEAVRLYDDALANVTSAQEAGLQIVSDVSSYLMDA